jgi:hypothetical protein
LTCHPCADQVVTLTPSTTRVPSQCYTPTHVIAPAFVSACHVTKMLVLCAPHPNNTLMSSSTCSPRVITMHLTSPACYASTSHFLYLFPAMLPPHVHSHSITSPHTSLHIRLHIPIRSPQHSVLHTSPALRTLCTVTFHKRHAYHDPHTMTARFTTQRSALARTDKCQHSSNQTQGE